MSETPRDVPCRVLVVQRRLTHYRVPFFQQLREALALQRMELTVVHGQPDAADATREDGGRLDWATPLRGRQWAGARLSWLPLAEPLARADLVVLPQELRQLHVWSALLRPHAARMALWGHGQDLQAGAGRTAQVARSLKRWLTLRADWWFSYTDISASILRDMGCPIERITCVNNAIDGVALQAAVQVEREGDRAALRRSLGLAGLDDSAPLGLFIGSLVPERRFDLLLAAVGAVQRALPGFQFVIAGGGPQADALHAQAAGLPGVHCVGPVHGQRKAQWLAAADLMLAPAGMGLGLLEAMAGGLPLVTSDAPGHGPEAAYLVNGDNAVVTHAAAGELAQAVLTLLQQPVWADRLRAGGLASARQHTLQAMVRRFATGLAAWQAAPRRERT